MTAAISAQWSTARGVADAFDVPVLELDTDEMNDPAYAKTLAGWIQALTTGQAGYPPTWMFFGNSFLSSGLFTGLFAGAMKLGEKVQSEEKEADDEPADQQPEGAQAEESKA